MKSAMHSSSDFIVIATPRSPFARRIRLALRLREIPHETRMTDVFQPSTELLQANPLGLVPVLFDPLSQEWVPDSDTILDLLDESPLLAQRTCTPIWPVHSDLRARVRIRSRWGTGVMTAAVAHFLERQRPGAPDPEVLAEQEGVIRRALARISEDLASSGAWMQRGERTQASWDLGVALEYLGLRIPELDWAREHRDLKEFLGECGESESFRETAPPKA